jgi:hypothetical protein
MRSSKLWTYVCLAALSAGCEDAQRAVEDSAIDPVSSADADTRRTDKDGGEASVLGDGAVAPPGDAQQPAPAVVDAATQAGGEPDGGSSAGRDSATDSALPLDGALSSDAPVVDGGGRTTDSGRKAPLPTAGCLEGLTNYKEKGKFSYKSETVGRVKMWVPMLPAGCKVPVIHLANGTGASCESYRLVHEHLASHGFLSTCYESTNTGDGKQCIEALETAYASHPNVADDKIGSSGHEAGGGGAYFCLQLAEQKWLDSKIYAGHAMEPASGVGAAPMWQAAYASIKSPIFQFNGSEDVLVSEATVGRAFDALADGTEAYWYEATGATHIPVPARWGQESAVVFFRWKLLGDNKACEYFKAMPMGPDWELKGKQAEKGC